MLPSPTGTVKSEMAPALSGCTEYGLGYGATNSNANRRFAGAIGQVAATTGVSCERGTAVSGAPAPSWCQGGGWTTSRIPGGFFAPTGLHADWSYLYVADQYNNNVQRFTLVGTFAGWKGMIATAPTSGDPGCVGAAPGTFTPPSSPTPSSN